MKLAWVGFTAVVLIECKSAHAGSLPGCTEIGMKIMSGSNEETVPLLTVEKPDPVVNTEASQVNEPRPTLNLGGTGEVKDAINLNNLSGLAAEQPGNTIPNLVVGDMQRMPFKDGSMSQIYGNKLPSVGVDYQIVAKEAFRVLEPGGKIRMHSMSAMSGRFSTALREAGFQVEIKGGIVFGTKPKP